jgi:peptide deformylase
MLKPSSAADSAAKKTLEILQFPDPRLRIKAKNVDVFDDNLRNIVAVMYDTMYANRGVGLAATQVGIDLRIFVMDVSDSGDQRICAINPEILSREGKQYETEGCLSVEAAFDKIERAHKVRFRALDIDGKPFELEGEGLFAACVQHEIDHLDGLLFINHLSRLKQERICKKIEKLQRRES